MIRVLLFFVIVAVLAFGVVWLADRPGDVAITWLGYRIETSVMVGAAALALLVVTTILVWSILRGLVRAPSAFSSALSGRRTNRAYRAISRGIVAIGAGDGQAARRFANEARRLMPNEPLALLLGAQTAQLAGDGADAERTFRKMADRQDTRLLGLHGLFIEAQRRDDQAAARSYAEEAAQAQPGLAWAGEAVLNYRCADGDWAGALAALERNMQNGLVAKDVYKRQRAVLLTGRAMMSETERDTAIGLARQALKLCPGLVPAAALAGRLLAAAGRPRKASRIVAAAWQINPHPDLAEVYANIRPQQSSHDRLGRIRHLASIYPNHPESALALARAALDAQDFDLARESLEPLIANPTQRVAALMAELEENSSGDVGRSREWMARALNAQRDPAWTADGLVSRTWMPASPVSGRLDAFEWRIPVADLGPRGPVIEHDRMVPRLQSKAAAQAPDTIDAAPPAASSHRAGADLAPATPPAPATPSSPPAMDAAPAPATSAPATSTPPSTVAAGKASGDVEPVVPLMHAPDDPGPVPDKTAEPESVELPEKRRRSFW